MDFRYTGDSTNIYSEHCRRVTVLHHWYQLLLVDTSTKICGFRHDDVIFLNTDLTRFLKWMQYLVACLLHRRRNRWGRSGHGLTTFLSCYYKTKSRVRRVMRWSHPLHTNVVSQARLSCRGQTLTPCESLARETNTNACNRAQSRSRSLRSPWSVYCGASGEMSDAAVAVRPDCPRAQHSNIHFTITWPDHSNFASYTLVLLYFSVAFSHSYSLFNYCCTPGQSYSQARQNQRTDQRRNARTSFFEYVVCVSELANWQCEVPELQMSIRLSKGFLRSTKASSFVNLHFLAFGRSEKENPCNELSFWNSFIVSGFVLRHII